MLSLVGKVLARRLFDHPIFVVGMGRSGTTVLVEALGWHPSILSLSGEAVLIYRLGEVAYHFSDAFAREAYYRNNLNLSRPYLYTMLRRLCFESVAGPNYGFKTYARAVARGNLNILSNQFWCAKTFPTEAEFKGLTALYPAAKFIYIVRNGVNVVHSRTKFSGENFETYCLSWANNVERYRYLTAAGLAVQVHYEQLVSEPDRFFEKIFRHLSLENNPAPLNFVNSTLIHPLNQPTQSNVNVGQILAAREPPYRRWSNAQRQSFKQICGAAMAEMGYEVPF